MCTKETMNILLVTNKRYLFATQVCIESILSLNKNVNIFIMHSELEPREVKRMDSVAKRHPSAHINYIKIDNSNIKTTKVSDTMPVEIYYRLLVAELLPQNLDRCLYLDTDTITLKKLDDLYYRPFYGNYILACEDPGMKTYKDRSTVYAKIGFSDQDLYFNSGVILYNLKAIRKDFKKFYFLDYLNNNEDHITFHDQDVLNVIFKGKVQFIDSMYNCRTYLYKRCYAKYIRESATIIHYGEKPWNRDFCGICGWEFWKNAYSIGFRKRFYLHYLTRPYYYSMKVLAHLKRHVAEINQKSKDA